MIQRTQLLQQKPASSAPVFHAWQLKRKDRNCIVFEKDEQPGGAIRSHRIDQYVAEEGSHSIQITSKAVEDFINSVPGLQSSAVEANPEANNRFIVRDGKLHTVPMKPLSLYKSKLWSFKGKLRALREWFVKPARRLCPPSSGRRGLQVWSQSDGCRNPCRRSREIVASPCVS